MHACFTASLQEDVPLVHLPHEGACSVVLQQRWLRCLSVLGICLLPPGPNASTQLLPEAGAQRTQEAVACTLHALTGSPHSRNKAAPP
jgi:hypothetical protein